MYCMEYTVEGSKEKWLLLLVATIGVVVTVLNTVRKRKNSQKVERQLNIVITGASKGLGLGIAKEHLRLGDKAVICSRSSSNLNKALKELKALYPNAVIEGIACNVASPGDVSKLLQVAVKKHGRVDVFYCNAALSAEAKLPLTDIPAQEMIDIVNTNLTGSLLCAQAAIKVIDSQKGGGKVVFIAGVGSDGTKTPGNLAYGASKSGIKQLKNSLASELAAKKGNEVCVHLYNPGLVATDLLLRYGLNARSARLINILADEADVVGACAANQVRNVTGHGKEITYMTVLWAIWRAMLYWNDERFVPRQGFTTRNDYKDYKQN